MVWRGLAGYLARYPGVDLQPAGLRSLSSTQANTLNTKQPEIRNGCVTGNPQRSPVERERVPSSVLAPLSPPPPFRVRALPSYESPPPLLRVPSPAVPSSLLLPLFATPPRVTRRRVRQSAARKDLPVLPGPGYDHDCRLVGH
eukprot:1337954-Rhodomonas_salina.1